MEQETLTMSKKERGYLVVMVQMDQDGITLVDASERMRVCYRQAIRIRQNYLERGAAGLVHQLRDQLSNRRLPEVFRQELARVYEKEYDGFGPTLASEKMEEYQGLHVHAETLRRLLIAKQLWLGRTKHRVHRRRRPRRERFGEMVQIDGSQHLWFEDRGPACCLMVMIDDATGRMVLHMAEEETTEAALVVLRKWVRRYGVPVSLYADRKNVYFTETVLHEPARRGDPAAHSAFGSVACRATVEMIAAHSPQAKGRVERRNGLLQDRLVKELRLRGISTIEEANAMLDAFAEEMNRRFGKTPASPTDAHRLAPRGRGEWEAMFSIEETRSVQRDNTFSLNGTAWQIRRQPGAPPPKSRVVVRTSLEGRVRCYWKNQPLRIELAGSRATWTPRKSRSTSTPQEDRAAATPQPSDAAPRLRKNGATARQRENGLGPTRQEKPMDTPAVPRRSSKAKPSLSHSGLPGGQATKRKRAESKTLPTRSVTRRGAQVALQRSPILRAGKSNLPRESGAPQGCTPMPQTPTRERAGEQTQTASLRVRREGQQDEGGRTTHQRRSGDGCDISKVA